MFTINLARIMLMQELYPICQLQFCGWHDFCGV